MTPFRPTASCPLDGITVLDLSRLVAGNMVSLQLADFGAEVIKVEDPDKGDPLRAWRVEGHSLFWKAYARNKLSLTLNLRKPQGKELLLDLIERAQVLIENYRPGTLERMGLAPAVLHARNPRLIIVRVSGWGQTGPYAQKPGFGTLVEGLSGFAAKTGFPDRAPVLPPTALADMMLGPLRRLRHLARLARDREQGWSRPGHRPVAARAECTRWWADAAAFKASGVVPRRQGSRSNITSPRNVYRTRDGRWISISGSMQSMAERLYAAVGVPEMTKDPALCQQQRATCQQRGSGAAGRASSSLVMTRRVPGHLRGRRGYGGSRSTTSISSLPIATFRSARWLSRCPDAELGSVDHAQRASRVCRRRRVRCAAPPPSWASIRRRSWRASASPRMTSPACALKGLYDVHAAHRPAGLAFAVVRPGHAGKVCRHRTHAWRRRHHP